MKLFLVHCGYYDPHVGDGLYESHYNFFVVAGDFESARDQAKLDPLYTEKKMHIDGLQCLETIQGHRVQLEADPALQGETRVVSFKYRGLAPKSAAPVSVT